MHKKIIFKKKRTISSTASLIAVTASTKINESKVVIG
jgi:hypothetical protein